jgi:hypothetical protein
MNNDARYFWRRSVEEIAAARRSVTPEARNRHQHFARLYVERLAHMGAPTPFAIREIDAEFAAAVLTARSEAA